VFQLGQVTYQVVDEWQELVGRANQGLIPAATLTNIKDKTGRISIGDWLKFILHDLAPFS
jgi:hypothetical protein